MTIGDDLGVYFNTDDFGVTVSIDGTGGLVGIVDQEYEELVGTAGYNPELQIPTASIPSGSGVGSAVVIGAATFRIKNQRPDATARVTILDLEFVA